MPRSILAVSAIALISAITHAQGTPPSSARQDVPVTAVALFSSGVGFFEHSGTIHGNGTTELRFRASQMNDVLKSLVLEDLGGGHVTTITYPSQDPITKTLRSFQVDITANPTVGQLLNQLRGARVSVQSQGEHLSGTILGVESRRRQLADKSGDIDVPVLNIFSGATIRSVELPSVTSLTFDEPQLQDELTKALAALGQSRDQDKKPVTINFTGSSDRRVRLGYVVETPVWKTSYRLILDDKSARLQGWAMVENQTESDWNNVSLSLVSGRPLSFMMDLYAPMYLTRPTVQPPRFAELRPQMYDGGIDAARTDTANARRRIGFDAQGRPDVNRLSQVVIDAASSGKDKTTLGFAIAGAPAAAPAPPPVRALASTAQLGELFEYTVHDVTLPRQKSAMIPIVAESVHVTRVSIYNAAVLASNPLNGVRLKNTTGKSLLQGPLTVLEKDAYAGDAQIDNLPAGQERLLSYGVDLQMLVTSGKSWETSTITTGKIVNGYLELERKFVSQHEYLAENKSDKEKRLVVEHPLRGAWTLVDTPKPYETTASVHRFEVAAPAGKVTSLIVKEQSVQSQELYMVGTEQSQLLLYSNTGELPSAVRAALAKAAQLKSVESDMQRQINDHNRQMSEIGVEQSRIRENMKTVGQTSQYYQRLLTKLNDQESSIERLQRERDALTAKRDAATKELEDYLRGLTIG